MGSTQSTAFFQKSDSWLLSVLVFCSWDDRWNVLSTSRRIHQFRQSDLFWRWMCGRLNVENAVYSPYVIPIATNFRTLFKELYPLRNMWQEVLKIDEDSEEHSNPMISQTQGQEGDKKRISVYARFSPKIPKKPETDELGNVQQQNENDENENENENDDLEVTLPLHQRLMMIKLSHNLKSNGQALKVLAAEGGENNNQLCLSVMCIDNL